ncbi:PLC-like phosphodiesterase, TIM beta/alpha-barrel domain [Pseudocohnilembus persalinus]|uniref:PLC-like phosphodiesterase, TIM beta/alpha-barrel domain n=1 Tax=Pseudocohnilembus persalinus TaxID=266149 RepID=A0A0V0R4W3_PSEPJ|nr:PLC-like phosphodiesterase, TIM beta/alpha-barrel domain [Pseudocohnilembus persalinus]|eukprot:KRX09256.1 PLC-like phosphodiesterase, TIM beta/alpha-barrel domain [Pseudocohnilembus persalinus]
MGSAQVKLLRGDYISTFPQPDYKLFKHNTKKWMEQIDDDRYISSLTIPGTHQSLSRQGGYMKVITVAQCQSWSIEDQLNAGIRSFDLRGKCRQNGAQFSAYHGIVDQKMDIKSIFPVFYKFLDENPSEFIVIFIKEEKKGVSDEVLTNMFDTMIQETHREKYWCIQENIPKVKQVRGKIFFIPRWKYATRFRLVRYQDCYNIEPKQKLKEIENFRIQTLQSVDADIGQTLFINYLSGSTYKNWPLTYALKTNKQFYQNCISRGIIMIDFPGEKLIDTIIGLCLQSANCKNESSLFRVYRALKSFKKEQQLA